MQHRKNNDIFFINLEEHTIRKTFESNASKSFIDLSIDKRIILDP